MSKNNFLIFFLFVLTCIYSIDSSYDKIISGIYKKTLNTINTDELNDYILNNEDYLLFDTRSENEYSISHIKSAIFLDYKSKNKYQIFTEINKNKKIILYCSIGFRSEKVGEYLLKMGFKDVSHLYGGLFQWVNDGYSVYDSQNIQTKNIHGYSKKWGKWIKNMIVVY